MTTPSRRARLALLAVLVLALGGCFKANARSVVAGDGAAASRITIELDLGFFEEMFGGMAEAFGEEGDTGAEMPSMTEEFESSAEELRTALDELYEEHPELRDRFEMAVSLEDEIFRIEIGVVTENVDQLAGLYSAMLGSGGGDLSEVLGVDMSDFGEATESTGGTGGTGILTEVTAELDDEFSFRAELPATGMSEDDEAMDLGAMFEGLAPEVTIEMTAPGDIIETNGEQSGRTVTWTLDGTQTDALELRSEVDESVTIDGLSSIGSTGGGDDDDEGGGVPLVPIVLGVVAVAVIGFLVLRRRSGSGSGPGEDTPAADLMPEAPTARPAEPVAPPAEPPMAPPPPPPPA